MVRHELEHLLTNNNLVLHRCVDTIEQQDDGRPHSAAVIRLVGGHMWWKLRWQWPLPLFLPFELLRDGQFVSAALNVAGVTAVMLLVTLAEAFQRQPFIDLAVVLGAMSLAGGLAFVRFLERRR